MRAAARRALDLIGGIYGLTTLEQDGADRRTSDLIRDALEGRSAAEISALVYHLAMDAALFVGMLEHSDAMERYELVDAVDLLCLVEQAHLDST
jgi:hypothetical protein